MDNSVDCSLGEFSLIVCFLLSNAGTTITSLTSSQSCVDHTLYVGGL